MAEYGAPVGTNWVPVTIRVELPASVPRVEAFEAAERHILAFKTKINIKFDRDYSAVPIRPPRAELERFRKSESQILVVRAWSDPQDIPRLRDEPSVHHIARDTRLEPFGPTEPTMASPTSVLQSALARVDCGGTAKADGTVADVVRDLGIAKIRAAGYTGRGIVVGVVDGGITAHGRPSQFGAWPAIPQPPAVGEVIGGWPPLNWGTTAEGWGQHGNMIAFDVQAMAPEAELWDIRIWQPGVEFETYVSNAEKGYQLAIDYYKVHKVPHILVNSWGVYDSDNGPDYAFNPNSNIVLRIEEALDLGILILFAAGNCGDGCPFTSGSLCGFGNRGPGAILLGPHGHPEVMTVGAATLKGEWCGYTSQGPAALPPND